MRRKNKEKFSKESKKTGISNQKTRMYLFFFHAFLPSLENFFLAFTVQSKFGVKAQAKRKIHRLLLEEVDLASRSYKH